MHQIDLDLVKEADVELLTTLHAEAFAENIAMYGQGPAGIGDSAWHRARIDDHIYLAIRARSQIIGGMLIEEQAEGKAFLHTFFIHPSYQNHGYGQQALRLLEQRFPTIRRWSLYTPHRSYRNHHLYEKMGYRKIGELHVPEHPDLAPDFFLFEYERLIPDGQ